MLLNNKLVLLLIYTFITSISAFSQNNTFSEWDKTFGGQRKDVINDITQGLDGTITLVGQSKSKLEENDTKRKETLGDGSNDDILFLQIDKTGTIKTIKAIGRTKEEGANAIVSTFDGGYAIAGFTNSEWKGKRGKDAWLIKVNKKGDYLWEKRFPFGVESSFNDLIQDQEGNFILTGKKGNELLVLKLNRLGETIWKKTYPSNGAKVIGHAIALSSTSRILIAGEVNTKNRFSKTLFIQYQSNGTLVGQAQTFGDRYEKGVGILETLDGNIALLSKRLKSERTKEDVWLLLMNDAGTLLTEEPLLYGFRGKDIPTAFIQGMDHHYYITGYSKSHDMNAQKYQGFLMSTDKEGKILQEEWNYFGGNQTDEFNAIHQLHDGSILMAGLSFTKSINSNAFVTKIAPNDFPKFNPTIKTDNPSLVEEHGDNKIQPQERGYIKFMLTNDSDQDAFNIQANVQATSGANQLEYFPKIALGFLPAKTTKTFSIPLIGKEGLGNDKASFKVSFTEHNNANITPFQFEVETRKTPEVILAIATHNFSSTGAALQREQTISLDITITNKGDKTATNLRGVYSFERNINGIGKKEFIIPTLEAGQSHTFSGQFKINRVYRGDFTEVGFRYYADQEPYTFGVQERFRLGTPITPLSAPSLTIEDFTFDKNDKEVKKGDIVNLSVTLKNSGELEANDLLMTFTIPEGIESLSPSTIKEERLNGGTTKTIRYQFKIKENYTSESIPIRFRFTCNKEYTPAFPNGSIERFFLELQAATPGFLIVNNHQFSTLDKPAKRGEVIELSLDVMNQGGQTIEGASIEFPVQDAIEIIKNNNVALSAIPSGGQEKITISFAIDKNYSTNTIQIPCLLKTREQGTIQENFTLLLETLSPPLLTIQNVNFDTNGQNLKRGETVKISIVLQNQGQLPASNIKTRFSHDDAIQSNSKQEQIVEQIDGGKNQTIDYYFMVQETYKGATIPIRFQFSADEQTSVEKEFELQLETLQEANLVITKETITPSNRPLKRGEEVNYQIEIKNTGELTAQNIQWRVSLDEAAKATTKLIQNIATLEAGKIHTFLFSFNIKEDTKASKTQVSSQLIATSNTLKTSQQTLLIEALAPPLLVVSKPIFSSDNNRIEKGKPLTAEIRITNKGGQAATKIRAKYGLEKNINALSDNNFSLEKLEPGKSHIFKLDFSIDPIFRGETTNISFSFAAKEKPYISMSENKKTFPLVIKEAKQQYVDIIVDWDAPRETTFKDLEESVIKIPVVLEIYSTVELTKENYTLYMDNEVYNKAGARSGEGKLKKAKTGSKRNKYIYENEIFLPAGKHDVRLDISVGKEVFNSDVLTLTYQPNTINLHLLAIGIDNYESTSIRNLNYPSQDVKDIAAIFEKQEGVLFENVYTHLLCGTCKNNNTSRDGIKLAINKLLHGYTSDKVQKDDIVILYLSSHGDNIGGRFKILASDYQQDISDVDGSIYTLDFSDIFIDQAKKMSSNHFFLFVDACHSGAIENEDSDKYLRAKDNPDEAQSIILKRLLESQRYIRPVMSCQGGEFSFEHEDWKNGAFTEALKEAFNNVEVPIANGKTIRANTNTQNEQKHILTFNEVFQFLKQRVPYLVQEKYQTKQTPYIPEQLLDEERDIPFYRLQEK